MFYLSNHRPCVEKRTFMQQLLDRGHSTFCIALASQLFEQRDPDIEAIKQILCTAADCGSNGPRYFLMMLNVMVASEFLVYHIFSAFIDIFESR